MVSLILGLLAAVFAILRNLYRLTIFGLISFILGVAAWIAANKVLQEDPHHKSANIGRIIGVISTTTSMMMLGLWIRSFIVGG